jgi:pyrimidine-nucleoside phosphorylase
MHAVELIQKKRDKFALNKDEINYIINSFVKGEIPDYQMSAFLMAICIIGMDDQEITFLTESMLYSGEVVSHKKTSSLYIDKHSTGGVGDKISIPLAPAVAACGVYVPMIAGRGLGHTGGTLDKLESIPGFRTNLTVKEYQAQVEKIGCVIMGQTKEIAPADKSIYALRDVTGTVESIPLICSSIMSKKLAEGIDGLVLDVKFGSGAFMSDFNRAKLLAQSMVNIGSRMGKKMSALLTNMDQPLGCLVGNNLEIIESIEILQGKGPKDSLELTKELGAEMLVLGGKAKNNQEGRDKISKVLESGHAFDKFIDMVKAQGGDANYISNIKNFPKAKKNIIISAQKSGFISSVDCRNVGIASSLIGGGRFTLLDKINPVVGLTIHVKIGDRVNKGDALCTIHADDKGIDEAQQRLGQAFHLVEHEVPRPLLCKERISMV